MSDRDLPADRRRGQLRPARDARRRVGAATPTTLARVHGLRREGRRARLRRPTRCSTRCRSSARRRRSARASWPSCAPSPSCCSPRGRWPTGRSSASPARRFSLLRLRPWPAAVLATSLLALGIGGGALLVGGGDRRPSRARSPARRRPTARRARMRVAGDDAKLVVAGLAAPPEGRIYQLWLDRGNGTAPEPTEALFSVRKGRASVDVPGDLKRRQAGARDRRAARRQRGPDAPAGHRRAPGVGAGRRPAPSAAGSVICPWKRRPQRPVIATPIARPASRARPAAGRSARTA